VTLSLSAKKWYLLLISSRERDIDGERQRESRKTELSRRKIDYEARVLFYLLRTTCSPNWIFLLFFKIKYILLFLQEKQGGVGKGYLSICY
jgi:hypothetical protein